MVYGRIGVRRHARINGKAKKKKLVGDGDRGGLFLEQEKRNGDFEILLRGWMDFEDVGMRGRRGRELNVFPLFSSVKNGWDDLCARWFLVDC